MKKRLLFIAMMVLTAAGNMLEAQNLTLSDIQNSGCQRGNQRRANEEEETRTIILEKEGDILSVQLQGFISNCVTEGFDVTPSISGGTDGATYSVSIQVTPILGDLVADCECPFNVSFTLHGLETNSFRFSCWWYDGQVSLTEGEPLRLESITEFAQIDDWYCIIDKVNYTAVIEGRNGTVDDLFIPDKLFYEEQMYTVTGIEEGAFLNSKTIVSISIPPTITRICNYAFAYCNSLKDVYCYIEDILPAIEASAFANTPIANATLHVPATSIDLYKATSPWNRFGSIVAIDEPRQPLPFLEGNPIWVYKYEHIPMQYNQETRMDCWLDTDDRSFTYYFLGGQKEIGGKVYTMMGKVRSKGEEDLAVSHWLPVREENGIVYALTDSLPGLVNEDYGNRYNDEWQPMPYLQQGNECVLYNFNAEVGETLFPQNASSTVVSLDTYQLMDDTDCRVLKTSGYYLDLYEKLGYLNSEQPFGIMDPLLDTPRPLNGHVYVSYLNAYFQDDMMLYKAPDAQEGLCVNDTIWTRDDANEYARSYKADPRQEEVFSYIRRVQAASETEPVTFTEGQMATIILPTEPDAGKGKYYRLDRVEDNQIVFEQETEPRARIPYIIVPSEDFSIEPETLELAGLSADTVKADGIRFIGTYSREELGSKEGFYFDIIDQTPDCSLSTSGETGKGAVIGTLRAYLQVPWDEPYSSGSPRSPQQKMEIVLKDKGTGSLSEIKSEELKIKNDGGIYDLQGRKMDNGQWPRIYIQNGRKVIIK